MGPGGLGLLGDPRAGHEQRQLGQPQPIGTGHLLQMFKTLPTADHQAIEAFRFNAAHQRTRRVGRQAATIQFQIFDTSTLLCKTLCQQFATSDAANDQDTRCRLGKCLAQGRQCQQGFAVIATRRKAYLQPCTLQHPSGCLTHGEPASLRRLDAGLGQMLEQQPGGRLADHNDRLEVMQALQRQSLWGLHGNRFNFQQWQATATHARCRQALRQRRAVLGRPGQQQAPLAHG